MIIVSNKKDFKGLKGLETLQGFHNVNHSAEQVKPNPATWIKTAAVSWLRQNDKLDLPNLLENGTQFVKADRKEVDDANY